MQLSYRKKKRIERRETDKKKEIEKNIENWGIHAINSLIIIGKRYFSIRFVNMIYEYSNFIN